MNYDLLVECVLSESDWNEIRESDGPAGLIPQAMRELLAARSPTESSQAYWKLENHVVVQGQLFEASRAIVPAIMAALVDFDRPSFVRIQLLEILFQIVNGVPHHEEVARGLKELDVDCKNAAREGLWLLYRSFQEGVLWRAAKEVIERVEGESCRLPILERLNADNGRIDSPERLRMDG